MLPTTWTAPPSTPLAPLHDLHAVRRRSALARSVDLAEDPGRYAAPAALAHDARRPGRREHRDEADAQVEGALEVGRRHPAEVAHDRRKTAGGVQVERSTRAKHARRQHPGQVGGEPAAGDVAEGVDVDAVGADQVEQVARRRPGSGSSSSSPSVRPNSATSRSSAQPAAREDRRTSE